MGEIKVKTFAPATSCEVCTESTNLMLVDINGEYTKLCFAASIWKLS